MVPRKLSDEQERTVMLDYLCGIPIKTLCEQYKISIAMIQNSIVANHSFAWMDPLVEWYHETMLSRKAKNGMHFYLAVQGISVPHGELVDLKTDHEVLRHLEFFVYHPRIDAIKKTLNLETFVKPSNGYEQLLYDLFPKEYTADGLVRRCMIQEFKRRYDDDLQVSYDKAFAAIEAGLAQKIKYGGLGITEKKIRLFRKMLEQILGSEYAILSGRYGLDGEKQTLVSLGKIKHMSRQGIQLRQHAALEKLRQSSFRDHASMFLDLKTDDELSKQNYRSPAPQQEYKLPLSGRIIHALERNNIMPLDLRYMANFTILSIPHIGKKGLEEIRKVFPRRNHKA